MKFIVILIVIVVIILLIKKWNRKLIIGKNEKRYYNIDDEYNDHKKEKEKEIDQLLSKIGKNGLDDLSEKDRKRLDELSKK